MCGSDLLYFFNTTLPEGLCFISFGGNPVSLSRAPDDTAANNGTSGRGYSAYLNWRPVLAGSMSIMILFNNVHFAFL